LGLLNDLTLQQIFSRLVAFLVVIAVHGCALAGLARLLGDKRPSYEGRLTLNPATHLSVPALAMAILFQMGWIRPMRFDIAALRFGRLGLVLLVLGSLLVTLLLVPAIGLLKPLLFTSLPRTAGMTALVLVENFQNLSIWFVVLNLLPIPVVTGSLLLIAAAPKLEPWLRRRETFMVVLLVGALVTGAAEWFLGPTQGWLRTILMG
jgi:hypothetical protein